MTILSQQETLLFTAPPKCEDPVDVAFLVDASGSVGVPNYVKERNFVKKIAKSFGGPESGSKMAVITYSEDAQVDIAFGQYKTTAELDQAVENLPYTRGRTRIDKALQLAARELFAPGKGSTDNVAKILIVLTDGQQTPAQDAVKLDVAAAELRKLGVQIFAGGVGKGINEQELRLMTERDQDVFLAADFNDLAIEARALAKNVCESAGE